MNIIRQRVFFSGRVQGVGFRYTTQRISGEFDVTGFVRNLDDRRVELVAEGTSSELLAFLDKIKEVMQDYIADVVCDKLSASGEFNRFEIRH